MKIELIKFHLVLQSQAEPGSDPAKINFNAWIRPSSNYVLCKQHRICSTQVVKKKKKIPCWYIEIKKCNPWEGIDFGFIQENWSGNRSDMLLHKVSRPFSGKYALCNPLLVWLLCFNEHYAMLTLVISLACQLFSQWPWASNLCQEKKINIFDSFALDF